MEQEAGGVTGAATDGQQVLSPCRETVLLDGRPIVFCSACVGTSTATERGGTGAISVSTRRGIVARKELP